MSHPAGSGITEILQAAPPPSQGQQDATGQARALIEAIDTVLHGRRQAVYVSTPITTGPEFVDWWRANAARGELDQGAYQHELAVVIQHNIAAVRPLVELVESRFHAPVIDPTRLDSIPGWRQPDYHRFWVAVIERFVTTVVFADGWAFSSGCALEFAAACENALPTLDSTLNALPPTLGREALEDAARTLVQTGLDATAQQSALASLAGLGYLGRGSAR